MSPTENEAVWEWQWSHLEDTSEMLFREWIHPNRIEDFAGKTVLDAGCGGGQHLRFVAPYAEEAVGVDLSCAELAADHCRELANVSTLPGDITHMDLGRAFDIAYCIGVLHHTDDPRESFRNLARHVKPGGRLIVWVYSHEGNWLNRALVEPVKRWLTGRWPRPLLLGLAHVLTALLYLPIYTIYLLPLPGLPYYEYFRNWRRLWAATKRPQRLNSQSIPAAAINSPSHSSAPRASSTIARARSWPKRRPSVARSDLISPLIWPPLRVLQPPPSAPASITSVDRPAAAVCKAQCRPV